MKILLAQPPFARLFGNSVYLKLPLGLMLVAAMLKQRGHEVAIYDDDVSNPAPIPSGPVSIGSMRRQPFGIEHLQPFQSVLDSFQPEVVGISYRTVDVEAAHFFCSEVHARCIRTVAGGIHPSLLPDEELEFFDSIVVGEGDSMEAEAAFVDPDVIVAECRPIENLDAVVADRNCVIGGERYAPLLRGLIQTQRGCPYRCSYCSTPQVFGTKVRMRDPGAVREEVLSLNTKEGRIIDDSFGVNRKHGMAICRQLADVDFSWVCDMALQNVDEEICDALCWGGCKCVNIGLESAAPRWRELSKKHVAPGEAEKALATAQGAHLDVVFYFMLGFPGETIGELKSTLSWARHLKELGAKPCISIVTPYPKTKLWDLAIEQGYVPGYGAWADHFHQSSTMGMADCTEDEWQACIALANQING